MAERYQQHAVAAGAPPVKETLGSRLRRLREEKGISVAALALKVGVSQATLRQIETGHIKNPSFLVGLRVANELNVDAMYLALGEGSSITERIDIIDRRVTKIEQRLETIGTRR